MYISRLFQSPLTRVVDRTEKGSALIEALIAISILAVSGSALASSSLATMVHTKRTERHSAAMQIATEYLEQTALIPPEFLFDDSDEESTVAVGDQYYNRTLEVVINADRTRTLTVTVEPVNMRYGGKVTLEHTLAMRGTR